MAIVIDMSDSDLLREPIDRAYELGVAEGLKMGKSVGYREVLAMRDFVQAARNYYGERLVQIALAGIRDREVEVAVVLDQVDDPAAERNQLADLAYDAVVEHKTDISALVISQAEWLNPELYSNPPQIHRIKRDGLDLI